MLNKLIEISVHSRLLIILALIAMILSAGLILPKLNLDAFPDVSNVQVSINTVAEGLASEEVEQLITFPVNANMLAPIITPVPIDTAPVSVRLFFYILQLCYAVNDFPYITSLIK